MKHFLIFLPSLFFCSCAIQYGSMVNSPASTMCYVGEAQGKAKNTYILGIGGLSKKGLIAAAKQNMIAQYPLKPGEIYSHISVDHKITFWPIITTKTVYVSASILRDCSIESSNANPNPNTNPSPTSSSKDTTAATLIEKADNNLFAIGDTVSCYTGVIYTERCIIAQINNESISLIKLNGEQFSANIYSLYALKGKRKGSYISQTKTRINKSSTGSEESNVTVIGLGLKKILVQDKSGKKYTEKYE